MTLNVQPSRPSDEFSVRLRAGEFLKVEDARYPNDPFSREEPQNFLFYEQAYLAAKDLGPHGTLGAITVMAPGKFQEVTALDRNDNPVSMGFIPTWRPASLLDRIKQKDT
jgi:hypothetical protein